MLNFIQYLWTNLKQLNELVLSHWFVSWWVWCSSKYFGTRCETASSGWTNTMALWRSEISLSLLTMIPYNMPEAAREAAWYHILCQEKLLRMSWRMASLSWRLFTLNISADLVSTWCTYIFESLSLQQCHCQNDRLSTKNTLSSHTASSRLSPTKRHDCYKWGLVAKIGQKVRYYATSNHAIIFKQKEQTLEAIQNRKGSVWCIGCSLWWGILDGISHCHGCDQRRHGSVVQKPWIAWMLKKDEELSITQRPQPSHTTGRSFIKHTMSTSLGTVALLYGIVNTYLNSAFSELLFWFAQHLYIEDD